MQELIQAAGAAAARQGIQVAVMVFGNGEAVPFTQSPPLSAAEGTIGPEVAEQIEQDRVNITSLREQMAQVAHARDSALRQNEQLGSQLREAQARVAELESGAAHVAENAPADGPAPEQPTTVLDHDALGIETLNLPEKVVKACAKGEVTTIGQLREFFPTLGEHKVNQKDRIATAEVLMGYIASPQGATPPASTAPARNNAAPAAGVPEGFTDRPWPDRIKIARFKENKDQTVREKVAALLTEVRAAVPDAPDPGQKRGVEFWRSLLSALVSDTTANKQDAALTLGAYINERLVHEVTNAQVAAVLYCLGFDPKQADQRKVDDALTAHGLVHLAENVPAETAA